MITRVTSLLHTGRAYWLAAALCVVALAAVAVTVPAVLTAWRARTPVAVAPGLAALSGGQLADLLPKQGDFPAGWTRIQKMDSPNDFGYGSYHNIGGVAGYQPVECSLAAYGIRTGSLFAASVAEHDPAGLSYLMPDRTDVQIAVGREFNATIFDDARRLVSRCSTFRDRFPGLVYTARILEDSRPSDGPERFRYAVTTSDKDQSGRPIATSFYSYVRVSGLILSGNASGAQQHVLDTLFDDTLRRIDATGHPR